MIRNRLFTRNTNVVTVDESFSLIFSKLTIFFEYAALNYQRSNWKQSMFDRTRSYFMIVFAFTNILFKINGILYKNDIEATILALIDILTVLMAYVRAFTIYKYTELMRSLRQDILNYTEINKIEDSEEKRISLDFLKLCRNLINLMITSYLGVTVFYLTFPLIHRILAKEWILPSNLKIAFLSPKTHPGYEIHYVVQVTGILYNTTAILGFDCTLLIYSMYIAYRLEVCNLHCSKIGNIRQISATEQSALIKKCARIHVETFRFIKSCSKIFSYSVVTSIAISITVLTLAMFHYMIKPFNQTYTHLLGMAWGFFVYCACGELVVSRAEKVARTLYNSHWENVQVPHDRQIILFFLTNAQQKLCFTAMEIYELSFATFSWTIKAAFGYAIFLQKVFFKDNF